MLPKVCLRFLKKAWDHCEFLASITPPLSLPFPPYLAGTGGGGIQHARHVSIPLAC